jgi:hypothetical protein
LCSEAEAQPDSPPPPASRGRCFDATISPHSHPIKISFPHSHLIKNIFSMSALEKGLKNIHGAHFTKAQ